MSRLAVLSLLIVCASAQASECRFTEIIDLRPFASEIGNRNIAFFAKDPTTGMCWTTGRKGTAIRHRPWSSFKIPHLLIALETGAASSLAETIEWDSTRFPAQSYWPEEWAQAQTLESAFKRSVAWYFQALVPRIGESAYRKWLARFHYGNRVVPIGKDDFWLDGSLLISPMQQVEFLTCVVTSGCGVSRQSTQALDVAAFQKDEKYYRLYGKTGSGPLRPGNWGGPFGGWFVGYVRDPDSPRVTVLALYAEGDSFSSLRMFRRDFSIRLLSSIGAWPR